ncbi:MAG: hypothetical protein [Caudoviricetes sp.]|nr:MAG: hypothetical protein [Caudoviricetes sp.]
MSTIFATVAVVCTMAQCSDYVIDPGVSQGDAEINTVIHNSEYQKVWQDEKGLTSWLAKYQIGETIFEIVSIDIETQEVEIP